MATTENLHTGDASKTKFSFTFPYLNQTDVEVYKYVTNAWVKQTITTHYTFDNATTIKFGAAPAAATTAEQTNLGNTKNVKIKRNTSGDSLAATFYPGSAIRAGDLNDNYTQNLYVTQEASNAVTDANTDAASALTTATAANTTAAAAETKADTAISTANTASTNATSAVSTANTGSTNATNAVNTANAASTTATSAEAAVSSVLPYTIVANKAALLAASVTEDDIYEVTDTTDLEDLGGGSDVIWVNSAGSTSGQDIAALKPNVTWDSGITLKMKKYGTSNTDRKWIFQSYFANDPESKYYRSAGDTMTGNVVVDNAKEVRLSEADSNGAAYVGLKGPTDMGAASSYTVTLPSATPTANQILKADASTPTTLTWADDVALTLINSDTFSGASTSNVNSATGTKNYVDTQVATKQDSDADLTAIAGLTSAADKGIQFTGSGTAATYDLTAFAKTILDDADAGAVRTTIGARVGDAVLASDQSWSGAQRGTIPTPVTHSSGATYDFDLDAGNNFKLTITTSSALELGFSNIDGAEGQSGTIEIVYGAITPSWGTECHFVGGTVIDLTQSVTSFLSYYVPSATVVVVNELLDVKAQS